MEEMSFEELLNENEMNEIKRGKLFKGEVVRIASDGIWVSLEATGDALVKSDELVKNISEYKIGDPISVVVTKTNDETGINSASERRALGEKLREEIKEGAVLKTKFEKRLEKGYQVLIGNAVRAFLPGSLSMLKPTDKMPENEMDMKVISVRGRRIVVSRKDIIEEQQREIYENYKENMIVEGTVDSIKNFGAFVKLNDYVNALIPVSEISWDKNVNINEVLKIGSKVKGVIIRLDQDKKKISISLKQLKDNPWTNIEEKYPIDSVVTGIVTNIFPFGFTVKVESGVEGLVHESEVFWARRGKIKDVVSIGDKVEVKVLGINREKNRLSLSYKQVLGNPWEEIENKYNIGNVVGGKVEKVLPNGAIIKLEEGITGFVHVSELSWNFVDNVEEALNDGDNVKVKVLDIDKENQKMKLSIKQAIENPWKKVVNELKVGDYINGKVIRYAGTGAVVIVEDYNVEAFLPVKKVSYEKIEDIKNVLKIGDSLKAKVLDIEFENEEKKGNMVISVLDVIKDEERKELDEAIKKVNEDA
ncbi:ribosomal protein S1 [Tepiditoga spiralis]|uniref:Ribosomal protein S1 n=1 Tax=Tepiditoga spiralis TaxID=2108365 RepID=A0A7G1G5X2_9BACT|nr:S1 RNA-binding domain-containing protein [Tepiditoga spiralis]BBE30464.1 ribosomal protein S1 [Tepiditoga spiralis]